MSKCWLVLVLVLGVSKAHEDTFEAPEQLDIFEINQKGTDQDLVDGDIIPPDKERNTVTDPSLWWESVNIPVIYIDQLNLEAVESINEARQEYQMRTCLNFVDRTNEIDYIVYQALSGCYSSIGRQGGNQTISIGSGCEKRAIVQHEMMHAIGIWHEQSRTDRDDYVKIQYANIEAGHANNFLKYDYDISDPLRVSYDYNSVMHYGDTSFTNNGEPTIVTRDPAFQDLIGQRRTFSRGDTDKINRMYNCSDTIRVTNHCDFEMESTCGFASHLEDGDMMMGEMSNWYRFDLMRDSRPFSHVPLNDNTLSTDGIGSFMLLNATANSTFADIRSMRYLSKETDVQCLRINYFINLQSASNASLQVFIADLDDVTGEIISMGDPIITITKNTHNYWQFLAMNINAPPYYRVVVRATTGGFVEDAIAFDDISVQDKPCDTGYFQVDNFNEDLEYMAKGEYIRSPIMYTDDGYAYSLKIFPQGTTSAEDGYLSFFLGLATGDNDDSLTWPMCNRFVRLQINDQNGNPLYAMDQYYNYLTSNTSSTWYRPTAEYGTSYGYSRFMKISDLQSLNNYMKHNKVIFSAKIKDMNYVWGTSCDDTSRSAERSIPLDQNLVKFQHSQKSLEPWDIASVDDDTQPLSLEEEPNAFKGTVAASIAIMCSMFVFVLMACLLLCVIRSQQKNLIAIVTNKQQHQGGTPLSNFEKSKLEFANKEAFA